MNQYNTTEEKSAQWGVTPKTVQNLCRQGKIPGAIKRAGAWFIPVDTPNVLKNTKSNSQSFHFVGTKKQIFQNAIELFKRHGYENVTIKDIAESAGIRQSAVYNHFSSKQKILDTIYDYYVHYFLADRPSLEDIEPILQNGSVLEIIESVRYEFKAEIKQNMLQITLLAFQRQGIDERARELIKTLMIAGGVDFVETVFNKAVDIGRLAPFDTHTISLLVNIIRIYTLHISLVDPSPESIQAMLKDEKALYELASTHLTDLKRNP